MKRKTEGWVGARHVTYGTQLGKGSGKRCFARKRVTGEGFPNRAHLLLGGGRHSPPLFSVLIELPDFFCRVTRRGVTAIREGNGLFLKAVACVSSSPMHA